MVHDLMCECYNTALHLGYFVESDGSCKEVRPQPKSISDTFWNEIWCWLDGLYQKDFFNKMNGRCSLKASIEFSMEDEENYMKDFLGRLKTVTPAEITPEVIQQRILNRPLAIEDFVKITEKSDISGETITRWEHKKYPMIEILPTYWDYTKKGVGTYKANGMFKGVVCGRDINELVTSSIPSIVGCFGSLPRLTKCYGFELLV
jgi:hypothetical protein